MSLMEFVIPTAHYGMQSMQQIAFPDINHRCPQVLTRLHELGMTTMAHQVILTFLLIRPSAG